MPTPQQILTQAIADIEKHGYDNQARIDKWINALMIAIQNDGVYINDANLRDRLRQALNPKLANTASKAFKSMGIQKFGKANLSPRLYNELDRRILASASLIKLNRTTAINDTLQRFIGWSTSIPAGGSTVTGKIDLKKDIRKSLDQLNYVERRVVIDQTSKLIANVNNIIATDNGAIAVKWRSHWKQSGYNYREDHKELDGKIFLIRDSWADKAGLVSGEYYEDLPELLGQAIFCQCFGEYKFKLKELPKELLTKKGEEYLNDRIKS